MKANPTKPALAKIQMVRCPTCGAKPGEKCELATGQPRTNPHRDRRLEAADAISMDLPNYERIIPITDLDAILAMAKQVRTKMDKAER
jgi:hypothetical protein